MELLVRESQARAQEAGRAGAGWGGGGVGWGGRPTSRPVVLIPSSLRTCFSPCREVAALDKRSPCFPPAPPARFVSVRVLGGDTDNQCLTRPRVCRRTVCCAQRCGHVGPSIPFPAPPSPRVLRGAPTRTASTRSASSTLSSAPVATTPLRGCDGADLRWGELLPR